MLFIPPVIINSIPAMITAISKMATTVGPMIAKYAPIVLETLEKNLPRVIQTIESLSLAANVLRPNEQVEELGAKAMAADKTPEDFARINDYIDYLRNEVEVDSQALSQDPLDSTIRHAIGAAIALKGVGEIVGKEISLPFLKTISQLGLEPQLILTIVQAYAQSGLSADEVEQYLNDQLSIAQSQQHSEVLVTAYQIADPQLDRQQAEDAVMNLR
ncbi:YqfQ family protein [Vibrio cholerae]|uniref:YqfQ family protein n=2 Tax=Vibrio cholerae TaxID=666 RepID=UPI001C305AF2|nr:YqfQ family protein [Vibrio cholerae]